MRAAMRAGVECGDQHDARAAAAGRSVSARADHASALLAHSGDVVHEEPDERRRVRIQRQQRVGDAVRIVQRDRTGRSRAYSRAIASAASGCASALYITLPPARLSKVWMFSMASGSETEPAAHLRRGCRRVVERRHRPQSPTAGELAHPAFRAAAPR